MPVRITIVSQRALVRDALSAALTAFECVAADKSDLLMIDGLHLHRHLPELARARERNIKALLLSCTQGDYQITVALRAGVTGFVCESEGLEAIKHAVEATSAGQLYFSPGTQKSRLSPRVAAGLTPRQLSVFEAAATGMSDAETAARLGLSPSTVEWHRAAVMRQLGVRDWAGLIVFAQRVGAVSLDDVDIDRPERRSAQR